MNETKAGVPGPHYLRAERVLSLALTAFIGIFCGVMCSGCATTKSKQADARMRAFMPTNRHDVRVEAINEISQDPDRSDLETLMSIVEYNFNPFELRAIAASGIMKSAHPKYTQRLLEFYAHPCVEGHDEPGNIVPIDGSQACNASPELETALVLLFVQGDYWNLEKLEKYQKDQLAFIHPHKQDKCRCEE